jgi:hypothetical protein
MSEKKRRRRWWLLAVLLLLLLGYGGYRVFATDPDVERVRELRKELSAQDLTPEQRRELFGQLREAMGKLSAEDRKAEGRDMARERQKRFAAELAQYHRMSPRERTAYLDEQIRRSEERRRQREQAGQSRGGTASAPGAAPTAGTSRPPLSTEDRVQMRKQRLDETTPEFRAQLDQYRAEMAARRQQLGLPPTPPRR